MNRKTFENRFRALQLHQTELDRKWRVYREEEEQRQILEAAGQKNVYVHTATGGVGFNKNWETVVNTAYLYTQENLDAVIFGTIVPFTREGNRFIFSTVQDIVNFYEEVVNASLISQPIGNAGYSLGVGTRLRGSVQEVFLDLSNGTRVVTWELMTQITSQADLPVGGNSPDGTIGYGAVYLDWNADGVADTTSDSPPSSNTDPLRFQSIL